MDDFIKNIKRKLSVDDDVVFEKDDADVKHEDDMRKTLEKIEPNDMVGVDEIASKLNELSQQAKSVLEDRAQDIPKSNYSVLEKSSLHEPPIQKQDPYIKDDNLLAFID